MIFLIGIAAIAFVMMVGRTYTAKKAIERTGIVNATKDLSDALSENVEKINVDTVNKAVDSLKEKAHNGQLDNASDIKEAVKETGREIGIEISEDEALKITDAIDSLEDLGLSPEVLIDETQKVCQKYGDEFLDHMGEAFVEASKDAAGNIAEDVWDSVEDTVRQLYQ